MSHTNDSLARLSEMAALLGVQAARVGALKVLLDEAIEAHRRTERETIPEMMLEIGMLEFTLTDGRKIKVSEEVSVNIPEGGKEEAHDWLRQNGFGGIIKTEVKVSFPRGQNESARVLAARLEAETGNVAIATEAVHPMTLKSFVKERLEAGHPGFPLDLFGAHPYSRAVVKEVNK